MEEAEIEKIQIATNIKAVRKEKKLSQKELAQKIGVSSQVISNWERNYTTPTAYDIQKIARELEVGTERIITGVNSKTIDEYINNTIENNDIVIAVMKLLGEEFIEDLATNKINIENLLKMDLDLTYKGKVLSSKEKQKILELINIMNN